MTSTSLAVSSTVTPTSGAPSVYETPLAEALLENLRSGGVSLDSAEARCAAQVIVRDLGEERLREIGPPDTVAESARRDGVAAFGSLSIQSLAAYANCIGPAHMLEQFLALFSGDQNRPPISEASERCLRDLWNTDEDFRQNFLDTEAMPPRWELQLEECLALGGDFSVLDALLGANRPSAQPAFVFEPGGPAAWWPGGALAGCGEVYYPEERTGVVRYDPVTKQKSFIGPSEEFTCSHLAVAPDGRRAVFTPSDPAEGLWMLDLVTGNVQSLAVPGVRSAFSPAWSPDGKWIAFDRSEADGIFVVRPDGSGLRRVGPGNTPMWSADGQKLLVSREKDPGLALIDFNTGSERALLPEAVYAALAPDGTIAWLDSENILRVAEVGEESELVRGLESETFETMRPPVWSADGRWLLLKSINYDWIIVQPSTGTIHRIGEIDLETFDSVSWLEFSTI